MDSAYVEGTLTVWSHEPGAETRDAKSSRQDHKDGLREGCSGGREDAVEDSRRNYSRKRMQETGRAE